MKIEELEGLVENLTIEQERAQEDLEAVKKAVGEENERVYQYRQLMKDLLTELLETKYGKPPEAKYDKIEEHPDCENLKRFLQLCYSRSILCYDYRLVAECEGVWRLQAHEFDIEMPTAPWDVGSLVMKDGIYHFTRDKLWRSEQYPSLDPEDLEKGKILLKDGEFQFVEEAYSDLDLFYGKPVEGKKSAPEDLCFTGEHK